MKPFTPPDPQTEVFLYVYSPDLATGTCLDGIASVLGLDRLKDETDVDLRARIKQRQKTLWLYMNS